MDGDAVIKVVFGQRGSGKTTKAAGLTGGKPRVLCFDTLGHDYKDGVIVESLDELRAFWRRCYRGRFRIVYRPLDPFSEFPEVCRLVYACGNLSFVVEEVDLFFRVGRCDPAFTQIISRGRHAGVELVAVTPAPKGFGSLLRSQAHEWYIFATREPDHVAYFGARCPGVPPHVFASLGEYQYVHYVDGATNYTICKDDLSGGGQVQTYPLDRVGSPAGLDAAHCGQVGGVVQDGAASAETP